MPEQPKIKTLKGMDISVLRCCVMRLLTSANCLFGARQNKKNRRWREGRSMDGIRNGG